MKILFSFNLFFAFIIVLFTGCDQRTNQTKAVGETASSSILTDSSRVLDILIQGRHNQELIQPLSKNYASYTIDDAYLIQTKLIQRLKPELGEVTGYKIAYATQEAMEASDINEPVYGPFFEKQQIKHGENVELSEFITFGIENEIAFTLNQDITQPVASLEELKPLVKSISLAFDIATARFDVSQKRKIHDFIISGGGAHRFMVGEPLENNDIDLVAHILTIQKDSEIVYSGNTDEVYGNPWNALFWIINDLIEHNRPVKKNMVFLTGKVDNPYKPSMEKASGTYVGSAEGFADISCVVK